MEATLTPNLTEEPRYRVVGKDWVDGGNGVPQAPGSEFVCRGWPPKTSVEPVNESARRIFEYDRAGRMGMGPDTPFDFKLGRFYLPDLGDIDRRSKQVRLVAPERVLPGMPTWRALLDIPLQRFGMGDDRNAFGKDIHRGDLIVSISWPRRIFANEFEEADEAAEAVRSYFEASRDHPQLPISPWDWFGRALFLPVLPELRRRGHDHDDDYRTARPDPVAVRASRGRGAARPIEA